jgi:hypothetical protein
MTWFWMASIWLTTSGGRSSVAARVVSCGIASGNGVLVGVGWREKTVPPVTDNRPKPMQQMAIRVSREKTTGRFIGI